MAKNDDNVTSSIEAYLDKIITDDINAAQVRSSKVYTELLVSLSSSETLPVTLRSEEHRDREPREILELVENEKNIIISGASGSGKTKTLSWLNVTYAKKYKDDKNQSVPIYIELNTYNEGTFFDFVKIKVKEKGLNESALRLLLEKNSLILIDGLDLLSPSDDFRCYDNILNFISKYSDCRYVISSRPGYFDAFKRSQFKIFELEELTDEMMELFIEKYARDDKSIEFIKNKIFNEKFKSLYRNPLMLFLGIKVAKEIIDKKEAEKTDVFSTRSKLYEGFIDYLFYHHHREKGRILHANEVQIGETLKDIYFKLQCNNETICTYENALDVAREHTRGYKETVPEKILDDVFELGLLFKNKTIVQYGIHQSFQEYFAALKLVS